MRLDEVNYFVEETEVGPVFVTNLLKREYELFVVRAQLFSFGGERERETAA